jgi:hypothetical protein
MAKLKSFRAEAGISLDIKGTWYKFYCGVELEMEEGDNSAEVKQKAWNTVHQELEKQVLEVANQ